MNLLRPLRWGLLGLLVLSPLPFAAVQPGAVLLVELCAVLLGLLAVRILARDPGALPSAARRALVPAGLILLVGVVQLVPLPPSWTGAIAGPTHEARLQVAAIAPETARRWAPLSLSPPSTLDALLRLAAYVALGVAASVAFRRPEDRTRLAVVVAACAAFQALYGTAEYLSGHQHIFGYAKKHFLDSATGTFINRNHFAIYLAMALPLTLALVSPPPRSTGGKTGLRGRLVRLGKPEGIRSLLASACIVAIWIGVFVSYSRGGLAAALVGTAVYVVTLRGSRTARLAAALLVISVVALSWAEIRAPGERFLQVEHVENVGGRLPTWRASLPIVGDFPVFGTGLGTYDEVFTLYRTPELVLRPGHAHNEWLQSAVEGGLPTAALVVWLGLVVLRPRRWWRQVAPPPATTAALVAALVAVGFHGLVDFPFRIPALAVLTACLAGALCAAARDDELGQANVHRHPGS